MGKTTCRAYFCICVSVFMGCVLPKFSEPLGVCNKCHMPDVTQWRTTSVQLRRTVCVLSLYSQNSQSQSNQISHNTSKQNNPVSINHFKTIEISLLYYMRGLCTLTRSHWLFLENMWRFVVWPPLNAKFVRGRRAVNFHLWKGDGWWSAGKTSEEQAVVGVEDSPCVPSLLLLFTFSWGFPSSFNSKHIQNITWP